MANDGDLRMNYLMLFAENMRQAIGGGLLGPAAQMSGIDAICGPRAGALEIGAGFGAGKLLKALSADDFAALRQLVPWPFSGEPSAFMTGRYLRVEAGWPDELQQTNIFLGDLGQRPNGGGRWLVGRSEEGSTVTASLSDQTPHWLFAGQSGAGKSVALTSALGQLARSGDMMVLIDLKWGSTFGPLSLPGLIGPMARDVEGAKVALGWAVQEMRRRYVSGDKPGRLVIAVDEVQELADDAGAVDMLRRLTVQGRGVQMHLLLGTQHPLMSSFGGESTIKRNLTGRLALRVDDAKASEVAVGAPTPRADRLLGRGDGYAVAPGRSVRVQVAQMEPAELARLCGAVPAMAEWPALEWEGLGQELPSGSGGAVFTADELAVSLIQAQLGNGRPAMCRALEANGLKAPGAEKGMRLLRVGRELREALQRAGWAVCLSGDETDTLSGSYGLAFGD